MGGKTSTSTSQVQIPPDVLARYNSVNQTAQQVAQTPFQQYSTSPSAFVQPLTPTQQSGVANTNAAAGMAQPYFQAGTGFALAGSQPVNANPLDTSSYMNPYLQTVLGSTEAMVNQQNQQAQSGQTGNAMSQGYFGGDRSGIASAVLQGQQELAGGQLYSGIASDAYQQALAAAQQQQGVGLGAAQANRAALQQTGDTLAQLGTGAQGAALSGAQAQLGAGQVEQQTGQAGLTALYNQFLQQQSYPFQTAQFLANIAEGTGALSGSTTATTQPGGLLSDERAKEDIEPIGQGFDGANIIRFRYKGDPTTRIGMSAQEVEHRHPEAVSEGPGGFKVVDYGAATDDAARRGFGMAANDNGGDRRERQAGGGMSGWGMYPSGSNPMVIQQLLESQAQMYAPYSGQGGPGLYGGSASGMPHGGSSYVPSASLPVGQLQVAKPVATQPSGLASDLHAVAGLADDAEGLSKDYHFAHEGYDKLRNWTGGGGGGGGNMVGPPGEANGGRIGRASGGWQQALQAAAAAQRQRVADQERTNRAMTLSHEQRPVNLGRAMSQPADPRYFKTAPARAPATASPGFNLDHYLGNLADTLSGGLNRWTGQPMNAPDPRAAAGNAAVGSVWHGLDHYLGNVADTLSGGANAWVDHPMWGPGQQGAEAGLSAGRAAAAQIGAARAAAIRHHTQQAQAHTDAAAQLAAPTAAPTDQASSNLAGATGLPSNIAPVHPLDVGDTSNLQTGFAPANLRPYNPNIFQRFGNWAGDELGGVGRWLSEPSQSRAVSQDVAAANQHEAPLRQLAPDPIQSQAFQPASAPVMQSEAFQGRTMPTPAAAPIQSEAFDAPVRRLDPVGDDLAPPVTLATGGFARAHRQMGGDLSNPQNDNPYATQGPGLNIPTAETQHAKLATAAPPGQGPSGLSQALGAGADVASIGTAAAKFLPMLLALRRGGRAGYADGGGPPAPDSTPDPSPDEVANWSPAVAQLEETRHPQWATPQMMAKGASGREAPVRAAAPDPGADPTAQPVTHDPDAGGFAPADTSAIPAAAAAPAGGPSGGGKRGGFSLANLIGGAGHMIGEAIGAPQNGQGWDFNKTLPFVTGLADMLAAPTKYPLVALTQGLKGGAQSYMAQKQQEAQIGQENAAAQLQRFQAQPIAQQAGYMELPGPLINSDGSINRDYSRLLPSGQWVHLGHPSGGAPGAGGAPAPGLATAQTQQGPHGGAGAPALPSRGPIQVDYDHGGRQTWAPSDASDAQMQAYHLDTSGTEDAAWNNRRAVAVNTGLQADQAVGDQAIKDNGVNQAAALTNARNLRMLGQAINSIPQSGLAAMGEDYGARQEVIRAVQTARRMVGLGEDDTLNKDTTPAEIISKINGLASVTLAHAGGQHSADIANGLKSILPSGGSANIGAANHIIASLMTQNQQDLDFGQFANAYAAKYGTSAGVNQAFQKEMQPIYGQETGTLERMMARNGRPQSLAEYIQAHPDRLKDFEQGYGGAAGWGTGIGRYFPGGV